jgi:hypothetical protein
MSTVINKVMSTVMSTVRNTVMNTVMNTACDEKMRPDWYDSPLDRRTHFLQERELSCFRSFDHNEDELHRAERLETWLDEH